MKITDVRIVLHASPSRGRLPFGARTNGKVPLGVLVIETDEGPTAWRRNFRGSRFRKEIHPAEAGLPLHGTSVRRPNRRRNASPAGTATQ